MKKQIYHIEYIKEDKILEYHLAADDFSSAVKAAEIKRGELKADCTLKIEMTETVEVV